MNASSSQHPVLQSLPLAMLICAATFALASGADELDKKYPVLASMKIPASKLPADCKVTEIPPTEKSLAGLKNLAITTDPKFAIIADERLSKLLDVKNIEATYFALYHQEGQRKWDLGIVAWACTDEAAAKKHYDAMTESYKNEPERFRLYRAKNNVIWLWRDPGVSDESFAKLEAFVKAQVAAAGK
jgi:hypothetical protein